MEYCRKSEPFKIELKNKAIITPEESNTESRMMVGEGEKEETVGIMIRKAKKTYGGGCFGDREVRAL